MAPVDVTQLTSISMPTEKEEQVQWSDVPTGNDESESAALATQSITPSAADAAPTTSSGPVTAASATLSPVPAPRHLLPLLLLPRQDVISHMFALPKTR